MSVIVILAVMAAVYGLTGLLLVKFGLRGLQCTRAFSRAAVFEGDEGEMIEIVRNDRPMIVPWLRVESHISPRLQLGRVSREEGSSAAQAARENLNVSGSRYYSSLFTLLPYQQIRRRHRVRFLHRGVYDLGGASLSVGDVLGLFQQTREQQMHVPVTVFPRLLDERELPRPLSLLLGETLSRRPLLTDPFLVRGIRDYLPGDPVRDIHWPATARMGTAQVRIFDHTARMKLMVILNAQRKDAQWGDHLMEYEEGEIEYGISVAATLCVHALRSGLSAGFAANMPFGEEKESVVMLPDGGAAREEELLTAFARLTLVRTLAFPLFLDTLTDVTDMDVLVLSCYDSPDVQKGLDKLRRQGNQVTLHILEPAADAGERGGTLCS
ncbi:MAG: DUF58 domain-containing protein [Clostridiales bacterium]|nr:DUF58 domain-containing protein [Clostridiales bacterium]